MIFGTIFFFNVSRFFCYKMHSISSNYRHEIEFRRSKAIIKRISHLRAASSPPSSEGFGRGCSLHLTNENYFVIPNFFVIINVITRRNFLWLSYILIHNLIKVTGLLQLTFIKYKVRKYL